MKKVLFVATVPSMIGQFNMENIKILQDMGYQIHIACNFNDRGVWSDNKVEYFCQYLDSLNIKTFQVNFSRNTINIFDHCVAYKQLQHLIIKHNYNFVHCHTPIASVICRLVTAKFHIKLVYTAHGFHFFKGASLFNWLCYYPIEYFFSNYTDILITINEEDYNRANHLLNAKKTYMVPGVGIDTAKFKECNINIVKKRQELGIPANAKVILSVGELNKNKNHEVIIKTIEKLESNYVYYIICGIGNRQKKLEQLALNKKVRDKVIFAGYRDDIAEIYKIADIFVFPSKREGLPVSLMEAIASGLPCVVSNIRGNSDLIIHRKNGFLCNDNSPEEYAKYLKFLLSNNEIIKNISKINDAYINKYSIHNVNNIMKNIYSTLD